MAETTFYGMLSKIQDPAARQLLKLILDQTGNLNSQAQSIGTVTEALDSDMNANGHRVTGLADPTAGQDAATKAYVDRQIQTLAAKVNL